MKKLIPGAVAYSHPKLGSACTFCVWTYAPAPVEVLEAQVKRHLLEAHDQDVYARKDENGNVTHVP